MNIKDVFLVGIAAMVAIVPMQTVFASGIAVIEGQDGADSRMEIEYVDRTKVRMNVPSKEGRDSYMLMRDGRAYMVSISRGETMVMDMAQLGSMAMSMGANMGASDSFEQELLSYKKTGKSETIAGYKGDVYSLTWRDNRGTHTDEAVLSSNKNVRAFSDAWMNMAKVMASSMSQRVDSSNTIWSFLEREKKGVLRLGDDFNVISIDAKSLASDRFVLPAAPMQMPGMGGLGGYPSKVPSGNAGTATSSPTQTGSAGQQQNSYWGSLLGQKTERQVDRQQNQAERSADREVDKAVDKAIGGMLNGIFGR